jgi:hypothetical protein
VQVVGIAVFGTDSQARQYFVNKRAISSEVCFDEVDSQLRVSFTAYWYNIARKEIGFIYGRVRSEISKQVRVYSAGARNWLTGGRFADYVNSQTSSRSRR